MTTRSNPIRVGRLADQGKEQDLRTTTPAQRLQMMWQLALDAWAFNGEPLAELRLQRHVVRLFRREPLPLSPNPQSNSRGER